MTAIAVPADLLPADGRFGSGPSKVPQAAVEALAAAAPDVLGTSHRQPAVKDLVHRVRAGCTALFSLPTGYEVALGNGGATLFWDAAAFALVRERSAHAVFGEFSGKFAAVTRAAPFLADPYVVESAPGTYPLLGAADGVDTYALTHNETSTGVLMPVTRPDDDGLVVVDATSAAGAVDFDVTAVDAYYFSPQKAFAGDGGLWVALLSPAAVARLDEVAATGRFVPPMLDLRLALDSSRKDQTYNTPAVATLHLLATQVDAMNEAGGLPVVAKDCAAKSGFLYAWAEASPFASPFVVDPAQRSPVVCTVDLVDTVDAGALCRVLRAHGVRDIEAYRKLGRNQVRVATFPAVTASDVERLTRCIDHVAAALVGR